MPHYVGLDVPQKATAICVVDEQERRFRRMLRARGESAKGQIRPLYTRLVSGGSAL